MGLTEFSHEIKVAWYFETIKKMNKFGLLKFVPKQERIIFYRHENRIDFKIRRTAYKRSR